MAEPFFKKLSKLFDVGFNPGARQTKDKIFLTLAKEKGDGTKTRNKIVLTSEAARIFNYWINYLHVDAKIAFEARNALWEDMDMIYYNSPILQRGMKMTADETLQADVNTKIIGIEAKRKVKKRVNERLERWNAENHLHETALNIIQYGNAGWMNLLGDKGVDEILPVEVYDIEERLEFTPHQVKKEMEARMGRLYTLSSLERINQLITNIKENKTDYSSFFKSYLFGFQITDFMIPAWRFIHFRNYINRSPFKPFGIPMYIHTVAPFMQYSAAMGLQVAARGASFPIDKYELNIPNVASPTDKLEKATELFHMLENQGLRETQKEGVGVGEKIVTIRDLFEFDQITPQIDFKRFDDIEALRDDIILASGLPRSILDPNAPAFGASGVALVQQFKPFARNVYRIQQVILENLSQLIKIDLILSGDFKEEEIDFQLTMPYPESQTDRDIISSQSDLLRLAGDVLEALAQNITGGEVSQLPDELINQVYSQILPYDDKRIQEWLKHAFKAKEELASQEGEGGDQQFENWKKIKKKFSNSNLLDIVEETVYEKKKEASFREGVMQNQHFRSSKLKSEQFNPFDLLELKKSNIKKLDERAEPHINQYAEEVFWTKPKKKRGKKSAKKSKK